jgi:predicted nucleic acid-binding protein
MIIAAVCLTETLTLVTDNRKDFAMPGLTLYPLP